MFFFFNDTATTEIYTLSLHDALPIWLVDEFEQATVALEDAHEEAASTARERDALAAELRAARAALDRKSTRLNSSHANISYAVFCLKKKHCVWCASFLSPTCPPFTLR